MKRSMNRARRMTAWVLAALLMACCLPPALAETFSAIVISDSMAVYGDTALSQAVDALPKDTVVRVTGYTNRIAKISYGESTGFALVSDMKTVDAVAAKALAKVETEIHPEASADSEGVLVPAGTQLYVLSLEESWARVERGGLVGYALADDLEQADDEWVSLTAKAELTPEPSETPAPDIENVAGTVTAESLAVYKSARTTSKKLGTLKRGQVVNVQKWNDTWAYIELDGHYGFCSVSGLARGTTLPEATPTPEAEVKQGTVTDEKLAVYKTASTKGKKLGTLKKGQVVNVVQTSNGWAYIELSGHYGFCSADGLTLGEGGTTPTPTATPEAGVRATVTAKSVAVYRTASESSKKLGTLKKGAEVNVVSWQNGWAYIELNGNYGFCRLSALTRNDELYKDIPTDFRRESFKATVIQPDALAYATPSTGANSTGLSLGAELSVVGYNSEWACITTGSGYAYVPVRQLSRTEYEIINGDGAALETLLKALLGYGYFDGVPSEKYNTAAITAIKRFQSACGLSQNGVADAGLQRVLYGGYAPSSALLSRTLSSGDRGDDVNRVQNRLFAMGYLSKASSIDSEYGATTTSAVKLFQAINNLTGTGELGADTMKSLYSTSARKLPSGLKAADIITTTVTTYSGSSYLDEVPSGLESTISDYDEGMSYLEKLEYVIYNAQNQLGKPYVWGSAGPSQYDCSGLTTYAFKKIGVSLQRSAYSQGYDNTYTKIEGVGNLLRGDLVYFNTVSDSDLSDHAGVYIGNGYFIHASSGGHRVVVSSLFSGSYYNRVFSWGRRVLP